MGAKNLNCRSCGEPLKYTFADLGVQPLCESYLSIDELNKMEPTYPLHVYFCKKCLLVQLEESIAPKEIYKKYAYFSSSSKGWLKHSENYAEMIVNKLKLDSKSQVIEIASNDGYLLQFFDQRNIPVLGIEPASNVAKEAIKKGIPTIIKFFDKETANYLVKQNNQADLLIGNNIIAQVPDIHGFLDCMKALLKPSGIITLEFHYVKNLIERNQFDTLSHERFSYFSFFVIEKLFTSHDLSIFDVEEIPTHGGSLRIYVCHSENQQIPKTNRPDKIRESERVSGFMEIQKYLSFNEKVKETKRNLLDILIKVKRKGKSVVGYGAHAEAHTLLNYCGIRTDFLDYLADRNPNKQGKFQAGTHLPIFSSDKIQETKPDYVLILPWSIKKEIINQMSQIGRWGGRFIVPIPKLEIYDAQGKELTNTVLKEEVV
jgi:ubiquinone/menaquinone biosynthesis C-methylase UbiE